ncbi:MAG TPA: GAF domain-containing protein [Anaerolineaceae bacterium]|nr:GAF domain-containing protein [Anaerolineaceae bacterium]
MVKYLNRSAFRVVFYYALASVLWIFFSDRVVQAMFHDPATQTTVQTYKGWGFVAVSCALLIFLIENEERRRKKTESALVSSQEGFKRLFAGNPSPMWVFRQDTLQFLDVNEAAVAKYGYSREEFLNKSVIDIRPPNEQAEFKQYIKEKLPNLHTTDVWTHLTKDNRLLQVRVIAHPFDYSGIPAYLVIIEDISQQIEAETALQNAEERRIKTEGLLSLDESRLEALLRLSQFSHLENTTLEDMVGYALKEAVNLTASDQGYLGLIDDSPTGIEITHWHDRDQPTAIAKAVEIIDPRYVMHYLKREMKPLLVNDPQTEISCFDVIALGFPFTRQLIVPVVEKNRIVAVAGVAGKMADYDNADMRQLSLFMSALYRLLIQNKTLKELRESQLRLQAAVDNLPFDFYMRDQAGRYILQNGISKQMWGDLLGKTDADLQFPQELKLIWEQIHQCIAQGETRQQEMTFPGREDRGTFYNIVAPFKDDGQVLGAVGINVDITQLKLRERELEAIVSVASALRKATSREEMLPIILDQIIESLQVDRVALVRPAPGGKEMAVDLGRGVWSHLNGTHLPIGNDSTEKVWQSGELYWTNDVDAEHIPLPFDGAHPLASVACVPLIDAIQPMNAIWIGSQRPLADNDINILKAIADIATNAFNRVVLNEQTNLQLQRLTALRAIDLAITSIMDVRVTLDILLNQITNQVGVDAAIVFLYQPHLQILELSASRGFHARYPDVHLRLGESYAGQVALERKLRIIPDIQASPSKLTDLLKQMQESFRTYIAIPLISKGQIQGVLELYNREILNPSSDWLDFVQAIASQAAIAIDNAGLFNQLQRSNIELTLAYDATIEGWSRALELRDQETEGHTQRVTDLTIKMAGALGISDEEIVHIRRGVLLHDIGKMGIPDSILLKPGPLTEDEWVIMRKHPQYAYELLSPIPYLNASIDIPYCHHERWDGTGYPRGLSKDQIPLASRLFSIIDNWDALMNDRPYRAAWPADRVIKFLSDEAGRRFDPELVEFFLARIHEETEEAA